MAGLGVACMAWLGLYGFAWNDYENEALPAMQALVHGHFASFASQAPPYGGSLLLRAPFAFLAHWWGGGALAVYQAVSIPCLVAAAVLGLWLYARMRAAGASRLSRGLALGLCVANPITLSALELGHAEELLGACMCVAAVLMAASVQAGDGSRHLLDPRALCAGALVGLAVASKESAVIVLGPMLLVLPARRVQTLLAAAVAAAALLAPIALFSDSFVSTTQSAASTASTIFQPWQAFWFFGSHGTLVHGLSGNAKPGYRSAPAWVGPISHPLIALCALLMPTAIWLRRRSEGSHLHSRAVHQVAPGAATLTLQDGLLLLCVLAALRCLLDTWDNVYYTVPLLIALVAWEAFAYRRPPAIALCVSALCWLSFQWLPEVASPDLQSAFFLAWMLPLTGFLATGMRVGVGIPRPGTGGQAVPAISPAPLADA